MRVIAMKILLERERGERGEFGGKDRGQREDGGAERRGTGADAEAGRERERERSGGAGSRTWGRGVRNLERGEEASQALGTSSADNPVKQLEREAP